MRIVVQRVNYAKVSVEGNTVGEIEEGLFILFGTKKGDSQADVKVLAEKISKLRIMSDSSGKMNLSVKDTKSSVLVVSQFTLYANTKKGNRPSFVEAQDPKQAEKLYEQFVLLLRSEGIVTKTGGFGKYMKIELELDGPVTINLESKYQQ